MVIRVSRGPKKKAGDFYTGGAQFNGRQNGFAIAGDYLSAASFLGIVGAVALYGYDGLLYSIGFLVAWLVALLLVAEPLRNTGKYTMADVLSFRMRQRPVRVAAASSTLAVSFFYLLARWPAQVPWCRCCSASPHRWASGSPSQWWGPSWWPTCSSAA